MNKEKKEKRKICTAVRKRFIKKKENAKIEKK